MGQFSLLGLVLCALSGTYKEVLKLLGVLECYRQRSWELAEGKVRV